MKINLNLQIDTDNCEEHKDLLQTILPRIDIENIKDILLKLKDDSIAKENIKLFFSILENENLVKYNLFEDFYFLFKDYFGSRDDAWNAIKNATLKVLEDLCEGDQWFYGIDGIYLLCAILKHNNISKDLFYRYEKYNDMAGMIQETFKANQNRFKNDII